MTTWRVAGIDLGASSGRVMVGVYDGTRIHLEECHRFPNRAVPMRVPETDSNRENYQDADPRRGTQAVSNNTELFWDVLYLWAQVGRGLKLAAQAGPIHAVGIDTWGVDYGRFGADSRLLSYPYSYRSDRTEAAVKQVHEALDEVALYRETGTQFQPFNTIYQLVADTELATTDASQWAALLPDLLAYLLTGTRGCEVTNASTTGMIDPRTRNWNQRVATKVQELTGKNIGQYFGELVEPGTIIGNIPDGLGGGEKTGSKQVPVVAVASHDTASAVAAIPVTQRYETGETFGFISSGTWSLVGCELEEPVLSEASRAANFTNELGVDKTVRYLKNIMGLWVAQECAREWEVTNNWEELTVEARRVPAGRTILDMSDQRLLAPGPMVHRLAAMAEETGQPVPVTRGEIFRCVCESLAASYKETFQQAEKLTGKRIREIYIVGGGSKNSFLNQLTAEVTGIPVIAGPTEATVMGNIAVQLQAIGALPPGSETRRDLIARSVPTIRYEP
ncbi:rhamnulokinase [Actinobaculum suis]|uniref:rhamnulokinase n=1 Tax=Actinobaculum suis TaxID=1657 RepID=UPI000808794B|nr:rhamnulokinase family protein [Actinobaculum suis]OCA93611.1 hypothetical protein ACU20_08685 [Actinobaculum suis]OCA93887.1 hypothetical protein ACU21_08995 [Actinobaculum suis]